MKIGLDIASVAYKRQADQIVLVAADEHFVPAANLARREGIDFILDPMWRNCHEELYLRPPPCGALPRVTNSWCELDCVVAGDVHPVDQFLDHQVLEPEDTRAYFTLHRRVQV
jgi:hypothetical protein